MSSEANYSFTTKVNGDLLTIRGDNAVEFGQHLDAFLMSDALGGKVLAVQADLREQAIATDGGAQLAAAEQAITQGFQATPAPPTATYGQPVDPSLVATAAPAAPVAAPGTFEQVPGKYPGQLFTYNAPGAPDSINGRMVMKEWTAKSGKQMKAWVDPLDGPKPARAVGPKADLQWVN